MVSNERHGLPGVGAVVAVASCKGGVGKTTTAVNLALALRRSGASVGLFDADLHGPNVPLMLGVRRSENRFPLRAEGPGHGPGFIPLARTNQKPYLKPVRRFGIQMMSTGMWYADDYCVTDDGPLGAALIQRTLLDVIWGPLDLLLIDFPPGTGEVQRLLLSSIACAGIIVVTTPQEMALLDTGRALEFYRSTGTRILGLVENMSHLLCPHCGEPVKIFSEQWQEHPALSGLQLLGRLPLAPAITKPVDAYHPLTSLDLESSPAADYMRLAAAVRERLAEAPSGGVS